MTIYYNDCYDLLRYVIYSEIDLSIVQALGVSLNATDRCIVRGVRLHRYDWDSSLGSFISSLFPAYEMELSPIFPSWVLRTP
ncbi:hypothetical protein BJX96DRAFT_109108 [Aspergillus floccosus]